MKELSIEQKAKRYDEILARAKGADISYYKDDIMSKVKEFVDYLLPELRESEDERIRKALISILKSDFEKDTTIYDISIGNIIAWLEKHGEQKPTDKVEPRFKVGDRIIKNSKKSCHVHSSTDDTICEVTEVHDTYYILNTKEDRIQEPFEWQDYYELVEQEWSDEDERIYKSITYSFAHNYPLTAQQQEFVKSLKNRVGCETNCTTTNEWSEEDEESILEICNYLDRIVREDEDNQATLLNVQELKNWLKSLRPQINITDEELAQAKKDAYNDALDKIEYHSGKPTFDDGWSAAIWYLKKRNAQPRNRWKESLATADLENSLCDMQDGFSDTSYEYRILGEAIEFIRCTESKPQWKPNDEQMQFLLKYAEQNNYDGSILISLYKDLKKLRGE